MRIFLGVSLVMVAFAANSVLNRMALASETIDPASFASIRIASGVVVLVCLLMFQGKLKSLSWKPDLRAVSGLSAYMLGFSFAYITLDAGVGALILFGGVQITMFAGAILKGQQPRLLQWLGAIIAFSGLVYLLQPGEISIDIKGAGLMILAAVGWGLYSLRGQLVTDPLRATMLNFLFALPIALLALLSIGNMEISQRGLCLAIVSGGVTSALGYALWYKLLPSMDTSNAAVSQLTVPIIAMAGGMLFLNESLTLTFVIASILVLGGVALSVLGAKKTAK